VGGLSESTAFLGAVENYFTAFLGLKEGGKNHDNLG